MWVATRNLLAKHHIANSTVAILHKNKMQPTNPNAHTYVTVTDVEAHGYAAT